MWSLAHVMSWYKHYISVEEKLVTLNREDKAWQSLLAQHSRDIITLSVCMSPMPQQHQKSFFSARTTDNVSIWRGLASPHQACLTEVPNSNWFSAHTCGGRGTSAVIAKRWISLLIIICRMTREHINSFQILATFVYGWKSKKVPQLHQHSEFSSTCALADNWNFFKSNREGKVRETFLLPFPLQIQLVTAFLGEELLPFMLSFSTLETGYEVTAHMAASAIKE